MELTESTAKQTACLPCREIITLTLISDKLKVLIPWCVRPDERRGPCVFGELKNHRHRHAKGSDRTVAL